MEKNFSMMSVTPFQQGMDKKGRTMAGEALGLTGCEVSFNYTPPGRFVPFVHSHKKNEEVYIFVGGNGFMKVDDEEVPVEDGTVIRVAPAGERAIKAGDGGLVHICIQAEDGSLTQANQADGIINESKASWMTSE
jgi:Uncharacterized conserved protein, contains double-stranded beta-helix domain